MRHEFTAAVRRKAFERAGFRCERCGTRYPLELYQVNGNAPAQVLCVECHTKIHQAENARRHMGWRT